MNKKYAVFGIVSLIGLVYGYYQYLGAQGEAMKLTSNSFEHNQPMDVKYTHYGQNVAPHLVWDQVPSGTKSLVLIVDDPDAPTPQPFVHAVLYNIDPQQRELKEGAWRGFSSGMTDFDKTGYQGPKPPKGNGTHRYFFKLYALDTKLDLPEGADRKTVEDAMKDHVLGSTELIGMYTAP